MLRKAPQTIAQYTHPSQFEPLLPQQQLGELRTRTRAVVEKSFQLTSRAHPTTIASLCELVRAMNSYYSKLHGFGENNLLFINYFYPYYIAPSSNYNEIVFLFENMVINLRRCLKLL